MVASYQSDIGKAQGNSVPEEWLRRMEKVPFPVLRSTMHAVNRFGNQSITSVQQLVQSTGFDPGLCLVLIKNANMRLKSTDREMVKTPEHAAMMLGVDRFKALIQSLPQVTSPGKRIDEKGYVAVLARSFHAAYQGYYWASLKLDPAAREVFIATLLHNLAHMAMWLNAETQMQHIINLYTKDPGLSEEQAQRKVLGFSLDELGQALAIRWSLPDLVVKSLSPCTDPFSSVQGVRLACRVANHSQHGWYSQKMRECMLDIGAYLGKPVEKVIPKVHRISIDVARLWIFDGIVPSATYIPMEAGEDIESPEQALLPKTSIGKPIQKTSEPDQTIRLKVARKSGQAAKVESRPVARSMKPVSKPKVPQANSFQEIVNDINRALDGPIQINSILRQVMHGLQEGAGLQRVVFALLSQDKTFLQSRFVIGSQADHPFSRFRVDALKAGLLTKILSKSQSFWLNESNHDKFWPHIPGKFKRLIEVDQFFMYSVLVNNKPVGLFYGDNYGSGNPLDAKSYERFKFLCSLAKKAFQKGSEKQ